jgi:hypothetical protein
MFLSDALVSLDLTSAVHPPTTLDDARKSLENPEKTA